MRHLVKISEQDRPEVLVGILLGQFGSSQIKTKQTCLPKAILFSFLSFPFNDLYTA